MIALATITCSRSQGKLSPQEVVSMCLSGTIKVHWMRYDVLKGLADSMDFSIERWVRFYFSRGMTWRVKELGEEYLAEVETSRGIGARRAEEEVLEELCAEHGHHGFFVHAPEAAASSAQETVENDGAEQDEHDEQLGEPAWFFVEWDQPASGDDMGAELAPSQSSLKEELAPSQSSLKEELAPPQPRVQAEAVVPPALPEVAVGNMLFLGKAVAESMTLRSSAHRVLLRHSQQTTLESKPAGAPPVRFESETDDAGWAERAWRGSDVSWIGALFTPSDATSLLFRSHHWAGRAVATVGTKPLPAAGASSADQGCEDEARCAALPVLVAKAIAEASADLAGVSALIGVSQAERCAEQERLSRGALDWKLLPSDMPGWPVPMPEADAAEPIGETPETPIVAASVAGSAAVVEASHSAVKGSSPSAAMGMLSAPTTPAAPPAEPKPQPPAEPMHELPAEPKHELPAEPKPKAATRSALSTKQVSAAPLDPAVQERQAADVAAAEAVVFACTGHSLTQSLSLQHRVPAVKAVVDAVLTPASTAGHLPPPPLLSALLAAAQARQSGCPISVPAPLDRSRPAWVGTRWPVAWAGPSGSGLSLGARDAASLCTALPSAQHRGDSPRRAPLRSAPLLWAAPPGLRALVAACGVVVPASLSGHRDAGEARDAKPSGVVVLPVTEAVARSYGMGSLLQPGADSGDLTGSETAGEAGAGGDVTGIRPEAEAAAVPTVQEVKDESVFVAPVSAIASLIGLGWDEDERSRTAPKPTSITAAPSAMHGTREASPGGVAVGAVESKQASEGAVAATQVRSRPSSAAFVVIWPAAVSDAASSRASALPARLGSGILPVPHFAEAPEESSPDDEQSPTGADAEAGGETSMAEAARVSDAVLPESAANALSEHSRRLLESMTEMAEDVNRHSDPLPQSPPLRHRGTGTPKTKTKAQRATHEALPGKPAATNDAVRATRHRTSRHRSNQASEDRAQQRAASHDATTNDSSPPGRSKHGEGRHGSRKPGANVGTATAPPAPGQAGGQQPVGRSVFGLASAGPSVGMALGVPLFDDLERSAPAGKHTLRDAESRGAAGSQDGPPPSPAPGSGAQAMAGWKSRAMGPARDRQPPAEPSSTPSHQSPPREGPIPAGAAVPRGPVVAAGEAVRRALFAGKTDTPHRLAREQAAAAVATRLRQAAPPAQPAPLSTTRTYQRVSPTPARAMTLLVEAVEAAGRKAAARVQRARQ
jgi:hypothetical protein